MLESKKKIFKNDFKENVYINFQVKKDMGHKAGDEVVLSEPTVHISQVSRPSK